jgi:hypothetical protein
MWADTRLLVRHLAQAAVGIDRLGFADQFQ